MVLNVLTWCFLLCCSLFRVQCFKLWFLCSSSQDDVSLLTRPGALQLQISQDLTPFTGFICLLLPEDKKLCSLPVIIKEQLFIGSQQRLEAGPGRPCVALLFLAFGKTSFCWLCGVWYQKHSSASSSSPASYCCAAVYWAAESVTWQHTETSARFHLRDSIQRVKPPKGSTN